MKLSVIIPTLNNESLTQTLKAIESQTRPADEVIVIGRDEIGATKIFEGLRFIDTEVPVCAAAARNVGMSAATGDVFVFTDADCIPASDWLEQHLFWQRKGKKILCGSVGVDNPNYLILSDNISMFHEFAVFAEPGERYLLPTLNLSVRREVWEEIGNFDESFPGAAGEDSDWTIRMNLAGHTLFFEKSPLVHHAPTRTGWKDIFNHWSRSGYNNIRVRLRYRQYFDTPSWVEKPIWLKLLSPLIAFYITAGIFSSSRLWKYGLTMPIVFLTKVVYCWGAARSIEEGFAVE